MPKTLLLADDSITIQKVVGIIFASEDYSVTTVDNGEDALTRVRELRPDILLADVVMPRKNGYELCEAVKADPELKATPVLLLAGTFEAFDEARAQAVGADGWIQKPFESSALVGKVREVVEGIAPPAAPAQPWAAATPAVPAATSPVAAPPARSAPFPVGGRPLPGAAPSPTSPPSPFASPAPFAAPSQPVTPPRPPPPPPPPFAARPPQPPAPPPPPSFRDAPTFSAPRPPPPPAATAAPSFSAPPPTVIPFPPPPPPPATTRDFEHEFAPERDAALAEPQSPVAEPPSSAAELPPPAVEFAHHPGALTPPPIDLAPPPRVAPPAPAIPTQKVSPTIEPDAELDFDIDEAAAPIDLEDLAAEEITDDDALLADTTGADGAPLPAIDLLGEEARTPPPLDLGRDEAFSAPLTDPFTAPPPDPFAATPTEAFPVPQSDPFAHELDLEPEPVGEEKPFDASGFEPLPSERETQPFFAAPETKPFDLADEPLPFRTELEPAAEAETEPAAEAEPQVEPHGGVDELRELVSPPPHPELKALAALTPETGLEFEPSSADRELQPETELLAAAAGAGGAQALAPPPIAESADEAVLREALSRASRETIERVVWEVVPQLAEAIIREHLERLMQDRKNS